MRAARQRRRQQYRSTIRSVVVFATLLMMMLPVIPAQATAQADDPDASSATPSAPAAEEAAAETEAETPSTEDKPTNKKWSTKKSAVPRAAADDPTAQIGVIKRNNLDGKALVPGDGESPRRSVMSFVELSCGAVVSAPIAGDQLRVCRLTGRSARDPFPAATRTDDHVVLDTFRGMDPI